MFSRLSKGAFPIFEDGDVELCLSRKPEDRLVLPSAVLSLHSSFFKASLSQRWSPTELEIKEIIKWKYALSFDVTGDADISFPLFTKTRSEAAPVSGASEIDPDTASIFLNGAPWIPDGNKETEQRIIIIAAHRRYLKLIVHMPLEFPVNATFESVVESAYYLVQVADTYDSLSILTMPIENLFARRFQAEIAVPCRDRYKELLYIATKIRSRWLFREIACRMIGDPSQDDTTILSGFYDFDVQELILEKRENLLRRMKNTDHELLRLKPPKKTSRVQRATTIAYATAAFRDDINKHLDTYHECELRKCYKKYRTMKDQILRVPSRFEYSDRRFERFQREFNNPNISQSDFDAAYRSLQLRASKLVDPLLKSAIEEPVKKLKKDWYDRGLLSMNITENELPWKDKPC